MITVNDIYNITSEINIPLLSDFNITADDFWSDYVANYKSYDRLFLVNYMSFVPFMQKVHESVFYKPTKEDIKKVQEDFTGDVKNFLMSNSKRYSELYREEMLTNETYSLTDNYNITEILKREAKGNDTFDEGIRKDTKSLIIGGREDITSTTAGGQENINTSKVSPYDSNDFNNESQDTISYGERTDSEKFTRGSQTDVDNFTKGEQTNKKETVLDETYNLTQKGNNGSVSPTEILGQHRKFWNKYEFYTLIFTDIAKALLLVSQI